MKIPFTLNAKATFIDVPAGERLIYILRNMFKLTDAKLGCYEGTCGNCMVLIDGKPALSCLIPAAIIRNAQVCTIEFIRETQAYEDIAIAFDQVGIELCGFCNAGKMLIAYSLLENSRHITKEEIRTALAGSACKCTDTESVVSGIRIAAVIRENRLNEK